MKKAILTLGLIAFVGLSTVSCSTDDSAMHDSSAETIKPIDNGDRDLPRPPMRP